MHKKTWNYPKISQIPGRCIFFKIFLAGKQVHHGAHAFLIWTIFCDLQHFLNLCLGDDIHSMSPLSLSQFCQCTVSHNRNASEHHRVQYLRSYYSHILLYASRHWLALNPIMCYKTNSSTHHLVPNLAQFKYNNSGDPDFVGHQISFYFQEGRDMLWNMKVFYLFIFSRKVTAESLVLYSFRLSSSRSSWCQSSPR